LFMSKKVPDLNEITVSWDSAGFFPMVDLKCLFQYFDYPEHVEIGAKSAQEPAIKQDIIWMINSMKTQGFNHYNNMARYLIDYVENTSGMVKFADMSYAFKHKYFSGMGSKSDTRLIEFIRHVDRKYRFGSMAALLFNRVALFRNFYWFQTEHMILQERFNLQTVKSSNSHKNLEDLLGRTHPNPAELSSGLSEIDLGIDYDISLFADLQSETELYKEIKDRIVVQDNKAKPAFAYFSNILKQPRTSFDLLRNIGLRFITDNLREVIKLYEQIDDENTKQEYASRFISDIDVNSVIEKVCGGQNQRLILSILEKGLSNFDEVYESNYKHLCKNVHMFRQARSAFKRYKKSLEGANKKFLMEAVFDKKEFTQRTKFDSIFGIQNEASYQLAREYIFTGNFPFEVTRRNISNWTRIYEGGLIPFILGSTQKKMRIIANAIETDMHNAEILLDFMVNAAEWYKKLEGIDIKRYSDMQIADPETVIESLDYATMEEAEYIIRTIKLEATAKRYYEKLKTHQTDDDTVNKQWRLLISRIVSDEANDATKFFMHVREIRQYLFSTKSHTEYRKFLIDLIKVRDVARDDKQRAQMITDYMNTLTQAKETDRWIPPLVKKVTVRPEPYAERPYIKNLVIIGGYRRADYGKILGQNFEIDKITTIGHKQFRRLQSIGSNATYLLITGNMKHPAQDIVQGFGSVYARSPTGGKANMIYYLHNALTNQRK
ncbi:MAG: hypothetical protein ABIC04_04630, partial [Nanoarchaeota archaeon]